jgi:hypothetical protein
VAAGVLAWLAAAGAATVVATTAVNAIGSGIVGAGARPLSQSEVAARLAASTPTPTITTSPNTTTPATSTTAAPSTPPTGTTSPPAGTGPARSLVSAGGTVIARCVPGGVAVLSAVPAQGYQLDSTSNEVDDHPSVRFRAGEAEVEVRLRCVDDIPQPEIRIKDR